MPALDWSHGEEGLHDPRSWVFGIHHASGEVNALRLDVGIRSPGRVGAGLSPGCDAERNASVGRRAPCGAKSQKTLSIGPISIYVFGCWPSSLASASPSSGR